jgi:hypothetical protein
MDVLSWLQNLGKDTDPAAKGFQPRALYIIVSVMLPVVFGFLVGMGLRLVERIFGVELGKGGGH